MAIELKRCPFCGNSAEIINGGRVIIIQCTSCKANIRGAELFKDVTGYINYLADLWNTRIDELVSETKKEMPDND